MHGRWDVITNAPFCCSKSIFIYGSAISVGRIKSSTCFFCLWQVVRFIIIFSCAFCATVYRFMTNKVDLMKVAAIKANCLKEGERPKTKVQTERKKTWPHSFPLIFKTCEHKMGQKIEMVYIYIVEYCFPYRIEKLCTLSRLFCRFSLLLFLFSNHLCMTAVTLCILNGWRKQTFAQSCLRLW